VTAYFISLSADKLDHPLSLSKPIVNSMYLACNENADAVYFEVKVLIINLGGESSKL